MDAFTLFLDTVAPIWRHYGVRIGEDIRDFLIVPIYRNEFTGEPRRYPVERIPKRSFPHWIMLLMFPATCIACTIFTVQLALRSGKYYSLPGVAHPALWWLFLPFFYIGLLLQWVAVICQVGILGLQVAITVWWLGWLVGIFT